MTHNALTTLAKQGDPNAIATLLTRSFQSQSFAPADQVDLTIKVDWQGGMLNLRLIAEHLPDTKTIVSFVQQQIAALKLDALKPIRLFAYHPTNPAPLWHHTFNGNGASPFPHAPAIRPSPTPDTDADAATDVDRFLVCGLGSLGQYCILNLKRFALRDAEIHVVAIDKQQPDEWEVQDLPNLLASEVIIGDCRNDAVLLKADIKKCRSILIVTSNESANVETAIVARRLNPQIRIVMRSSRQNLNQLLKQQLREFIAFEPTELPAPAFAMAGLQAGILGSFNIGDYRFQVVEQVVQPNDYRFDGLAAISLHKRAYRLLSYLPQNATSIPPRAFFQWTTTTKVKAGDRIAYVELIEHHSNSSTVETTLLEQPLHLIWQAIRTTARRSWRENLARWGEWLQAQRMRQVATIGLAVALLLWLGGAILLKNTLNFSWQQAISMGFVLLLGGYGDVFGGLQVTMSVPGWVQVVCGFISLASLASVLGVLGLVTDHLLSSRFEFLRRRPAIPQQNHVVVVGFGRMGQRVTAILREFRQPTVILTEHIEPLPQPITVPLLVGDPIAQLPKVNLATAKSVVVVTEDQILNLEVALMAQNVAQQQNRAIGLVVRTYDQRFRDNVLNLLPTAKALAAYELSAEAFAGAAFGENILALFRLNDQTILVTEYRVTEADTLVGKSLSQLAYGYGVVPIFHQRANAAAQEDTTEHLMPLDDRWLTVGDRLVVLASINGLRRVEHGDLAPARRWRLEAQKPLNPSFLHSCGNDLARISGCSLYEARSFMEHLPSSKELLLYDYQAHKLLEELSRRLPITLTPL